MNSFLEDINAWTPDCIDIVYEITDDTMINLSTAIDKLNATGVDIYEYHNQYLYLYFYRDEDGIFDKLKIFKTHSKYQKQLISQLDTLQFKYNLNK